MKRIVLASGSPRRKALLEQIGLSFDTEESGCDEFMHQELPPQRMVERVSLEKARVVALGRKDCLVIAADTVGLVDGRILGKPETEDDARTMLSALNGRTHLVITGFTIIDAETGKVVTKCVETEVRFRKLSYREIDAYVRSGEPMDKAGAYAIQGLGAALVDNIQGDFYNVVGLPICALVEALKDFGVNVL